VPKLLVTVFSQFPISEAAHFDKVVPVRATSDGFYDKARLSLSRICGCIASRNDTRYEGGICDNYSSARAKSDWHHASKQVAKYWSLADKLLNI
jgi:hypothetical protein